MSEYFDGLKAKHKLKSSVQGGFHVLMHLDARTAIKLQQLIESEPTKITDIQSILDYPLSWRRSMIRNDLRIYANHSEAVRKIIKNSTSNEKKDRDAGRVFVWARHHFPDKGIAFYGKVIEIAGQWENPSTYMSLTFRSLMEFGLGEALDNIPDCTEQALDVINNGSGGYGGDIRLKYNLLTQLANIPDHLT